MHHWTEKKLSLLPLNKGAVHYLIPTRLRHPKENRLLILMSTNMQYLLLTVTWFIDKTT